MAKNCVTADDVRNLAPTNKEWAEYLDGWSAARLINEFLFMIEDMTPGDYALIYRAVQSCYEPFIRKAADVQVSRFWTLGVCVALGLPQKGFSTVRSYAKSELSHTYCLRLDTDYWHDVGFRDAYEDK